MTNSTTRKAKQSAPRPAEKQPAYLQTLSERVERSTKRKRERATADAAQQIEQAWHAGDDTAQLPLWGEEMRAMPNAIIRGALFTAKDADTPRQYYDNLPVTTLSNITMMYRGQELRQADASVFMQLLHIARSVPLGYVVEFTGRQMLGELGWTDGKAGYERLRDSIDRLTATSVKVQMTQRDDTFGYGGSFVRSFRWKTDAGESLSRWQVWLDPQIIALFKPDTYSLLHWEQRKLINSRSPLTLWLHTFLSSHRKPIPLAVEKYAELANPDIREPKHFKQSLRRSLDRLVQVGFLEQWHISPTSNLVYVVRNLDRVPESSSEKLIPYKVILERDPDQE